MVECLVADPSSQLRLVPREMVGTCMEISILFLFSLLSAASLLVMTLVDRILGSKAEFLSAFSVLERILGRTPSAGVSQVARRFGSLGEFVVVVFVNLAIGGILTFVLRMVAAR